MELALWLEALVCLLQAEVFYLLALEQFAGSSGIDSMLHRLDVARSSKEKDGQIEYAWIKTLLIDTSSRPGVFLTRPP